MLRLSKKKLITFWAILTSIYIFYAEYLVYKLNRKRWHTIQCENERECVRILLVADPQIIGNMNEYIHSITPFSVFDCDRYLKKTYELAYKFTKPDVVLFLGDLMDEGHVAMDEDFYEYVKRIFKIFLDPFNLDITVKHIWLPGDNDIGGEDTRITPEKLQRFERAFSQPSLHKVKNITFFKINRLTSVIPVYKKEREFYDTSNIFVGISHVPLMFLPSPFVRKVIDKMQPQLLFTAHEHKSMIINTDALLRQDFHITPVTPNNIRVYEYSLGITDMYEIMIPTASYRMGTKNIGYGFAVIGSSVLLLFGYFSYLFFFPENSELKFTVLWSPVLIFCLFIGRGCAHYCRSRHSHIFIFF